MGREAKLVPADITWRRAVLESELASTTRLVAVALSTYMSEAGTSAFPGATLLSQDTGLSERAVREHLAKLCDSGWLHLVERGGQRGRRKCANSYAAVIPSTHVPRKERHPSPSVTHDARSPVVPTTRTPADDDTAPLQEDHPISPRDLPNNSPSTPARRRTPRDDLFDALGGVFGEPKTRTTRGFYAKIAGELLEAGATAEDIAARGAALKAKDWHDCTPRALAKHWHALGEAVPSLDFDATPSGLWVCGVGNPHCDHGLVCDPHDPPGTPTTRCECQRARSAT